ncbi:VOC family protein [Mycolicibacterium sp. OfavD-34-C]|uniref:VOC family protein n=1 Tax=Mycolicibacterium sp. OfavD-34-C TaxID=2917746 RepID=UPI001EF5694C|nr:VOC family protein [Mycolicibacterium sp. OfavD-34-C]MCG7582204.1 VOC family protein [Mycolicibacterium sp. OfavD-34-C]
MSLTVDEIHVADAPDAWARAGFTVDSAGDAAPCCRVGGVRIRLVGSHHGSGIVGWSLGGLPAGFSGELDGIATARSDDCGAATASTPTEVNPAASACSPTDAPRAAPAEHSNGVTAIDHVVLLSPDPDRTVAAMEAVGEHPRRERRGELGGQQIRQIFFRFGEVIVEVVGAPAAAGDGPSTLWGITYVTADIDATAAFFGERTTPVKSAVQPGRRITTVRHRELDISVRTAMISARH